MTAVVMPITAPDGYSSDYDLYDAMDYMDETPTKDLKRAIVDDCFPDIDAEECLFDNVSMPPPPKRQKVQVEKPDFVFPGLDYIVQMQERIANIKVVPNMDICILNPLQRLEQSFKAIKPSEVNIVDRLYSFKKSFALNVVHDNNDQFRAAAKFMFGDESRYEEVKRQAIGDIQQRPQVYNVDSEYVENVKSSRVRGDHFTLYAIAYRYRRRIEIVTDHKDHEGSLIEIDTENALDGQKSIMLVYSKSKNRYSAAYSLNPKNLVKSSTKEQTLNALNKALEMANAAAQHVTELVNDVQAKIHPFDGDVDGQSDVYWDQLLLTKIKDDSENVTEIVECADFFGLITVDDSDTESCTSFVTTTLQDECQEMDVEEEVPEKKMHAQEQQQMTNKNTKNQKRYFGQEFILGRPLYYKMKKKLDRDGVQEQLLKRYNKPEKIQRLVKWTSYDMDFTNKKSGAIVDWVNKQEYTNTSMVRLSLEPTGRDCTGMTKKEYLQHFSCNKEYLEHTIKMYQKVIPKMKFARAHFYNWKENFLTMYVEKCHISMFINMRKNTQHADEIYDEEDMTLVINKEQFTFEYKTRTQIRERYGGRSTSDKKRVSNGYVVDIPYDLIEDGQLAIVAPNEKTILIPVACEWSITIRTDDTVPYTVLHLDGFNKFYEALEFHDYYMDCIIDKRKIKKRRNYTK